MKKQMTLLAVLLTAFGAAGVAIADHPDDASVNLIGRTLFGGYLSDSGFAFLPLDRLACPATGTLTRMDDESYALDLFECGTFRYTIWDIRITGHGKGADGAARKGRHEDSDEDSDRTRWDLLRADMNKTERVYPPIDGKTVVDEVMLHTGCTLNGTFPIYEGSWDGRTLYLATHFQSPYCEGGTFWGSAGFRQMFGLGGPDSPLHDGLTRDDGLVHATFAVEMYAQ